VSALASEVYNAGLLTGDAIAATIAHEVKQPLSGMITNADAGLRWLDHSTPNLDKRGNATIQLSLDCVGNGTTPESPVEARRSHRSS
jgi:hypothetical protein